MINKIASRLKTEGFPAIADMVAQKHPDAFAQILSTNRNGSQFVSLPDTLQESRVQALFRAYGKLLLVADVRAHVDFRAQFMPRAAAS